MSIQSTVKVVTTHVLSEMKLKGEKISMLTAYDYSMARIVDQAGIDVVLVGDSASNVMAGYETTLPMTLDQMIYHGFPVINHLVKGDGKCGHIPRHDIRSGVSYQYDVDACAVYNLRCRVIIRSKHRNLLASLLHFHQTVCRYFACIA